MACSCVTAGPIPDEAMFQASTLEELLEAKTQFSDRQRGGGRPRRLQGEVEEIAPKLADEYDGPPGFYHGVASGDPLPDSVIIWYVPFSCLVVLNSYNFSL